MKVNNILEKTYRFSFIMLQRYLFSSYYTFPYPTRHAKPISLKSYDYRNIN